MLQYTEEEIIKFNNYQTEDFVRSELAYMENASEVGYDVERHQRLQTLMPDGIVLSKAYLRSILDHSEPLNFNSAQADEAAGPSTADGKVTSELDTSSDKREINTLCDNVEQIYMDSPAGLKAQVTTEVGKNDKSPPKVSKQDDITPGVTKNDTLACEGTEEVEPLAKDPCSASSDSDSDSTTDTETSSQSEGEKVESTDEQPTIFVDDLLQIE